MVPSPRDYDTHPLRSRLGTGILDGSLVILTWAAGRNCVLRGSSRPWSSWLCPHVSWQGPAVGRCFSAPAAERNHWTTFEWTWACTPLEPMKSKSLVVVPAHWDFKEMIQGSQGWGPPGLGRLVAARMKWGGQFIAFLRAWSQKETSTLSGPTQPGSHGVAGGVMGNRDGVLTTKTSEKLRGPGTESILSSCTQPPSCSGWCCNWEAAVLMLIFHWTRGTPER